MDDTARLTIDELASQCREESSRPAPSPTGQFSSCWELFRRAIVENDQQAWQALYDQYRRLVGKWAKGSNLKLDDLVHETFARFWQGVRDHDFTHRFPTMKEVMSYLKRCARTLSIDAARRREYQRSVRQLLTIEMSVANDSPDDIALDRVFSQELRAYLRDQMRDEDERVVFEVYCKGLTPREIVEQYPDRFANAGQVYRVRERIVSRLSEDPMVQKWWAS
jgi:RNA polymerase sigma factor (sigma-70 family)